MTTGRGLVLVAMLALPLLSGCPNAPFTTCDNEPDVTGRWLLTLTPNEGEVVTTGSTVDAQLMQVKRSSGFGSLIWGTLTAANKQLFDTLTIPQLRNNNGSKTGAVLACEIKINIPVSEQVTDDDQDNGPLRLSLAGTIVARGMIDGDTCTVIPEGSSMQASFRWTGVQQSQ